MPLMLSGSCRCGSVGFQVQSHTPYPYQRCYCSICRKAGAGSGYAVNIMGRAETLEVRGKNGIETFQAMITDQGEPRLGSCQRSFCRDCGTMLWVFDEQWPDLLHPFASCIDTDLPGPPELVHIMLDFKAPWIEPQIGPTDQSYARYPAQSIEDWHRSRGLWVD